MHGQVKVMVHSDPKAELEAGQSGAGWTVASVVPSSLY
jgi:hypothetical protein